MSRRAGAPSASSAALPAPTGEAARLAAQIGPEAAFLLIEAYGGRRIYIPNPVNPENEVCLLLGLPAYTRLKDWLDGSDSPRQQYKVPVARQWLILVMRGKGMSYGAIAHALRCSENTVWKTLRDRDLTDSQMDLFG